MLNINKHNLAVGPGRHTSMFTHESEAALPDTLMEGKKESKKISSFELKIESKV